MPSLLEKFQKLLPCWQQCCQVLEAPQPHPEETNQSPTPNMPTVPIVNPQAVQTIMVKGQLMQVVTPISQIMTQPTVTVGNITESQPLLIMVQNPVNQQVVQAADQPSVQTIAQPSPNDDLQNDLPPSYQV